jgi:hypothetical protein
VERWDRATRKAILAVEVGGLALIAAGLFFAHPILAGSGAIAEIAGVLAHLMHLAGEIPPLLDWTASHIYCGDTAFVTLALQAGGRRRSRRLPLINRLFDGLLGRRKTSGEMIRILMALPGVRVPPEQLSGLRWWEIHDRLVHEAIWSPLPPGVTRPVTEPELEALNKLEYAAYPEFQGEWSEDESLEFMQSWHAWTDGRGLRILTAFDGFGGDAQIWLGLTHIVPVKEREARRFRMGWTDETGFRKDDFDLGPHPRYIVIESVCLWEEHRRAPYHNINVYRATLQHICEFYDPDSGVHPVLLAYPAAFEEPVLERFGFERTGGRRPVGGEDIYELDIGRYAELTLEAQVWVDALRSLARHYRLRGE